MVLRCAWGTCNNDERYPYRMNGARFILYPKPKTNLEKCLRWIKSCGRPHCHLNVHNINKHKAVCSTVNTLIYEYFTKLLQHFFSSENFFLLNQHFVGGCGPTSEFPDPIPADGSVPTKQRKSPKRRQHFEAVSPPVNKKQKKDVLTQM